MADRTLAEAQGLADQLTPRDQEHLPAYVTVRLAQVVTALPHLPGRTLLKTSNVRQIFFQLGAKLVATDAPECETLAAVVLAELIPPTSSSSAM